MNEAWPFICRSGRTSTPGWCIGMHEVGDAAVLGHVPVGAGQQHPVVGVVGAGVPHLLAVDDPLVAVALGAGGEPGQVGAAARLAEQLAPRVLAGDGRPQEAALQVVGAVLEDRRRGQAHAAAAGGADRADPAELVVPRRRSAAAGRPRPYHSFGHAGQPQPESTSISRHSTRDRSGSQFAASHSRTSAATDSIVARSVTGPPFGPSTFADRAGGTRNGPGRRGG